MAKVKFYVILNYLKFLGRDEVLDLIFIKKWIFLLLIYYKHLNCLIKLKNNIPRGVMKLNHFWQGTLS